MDPYASRGRTIHSPMPLSTALPSSVYPHLTNPSAKSRMSSESSFFKMKEKAMASGAGTVDIMGQLQKSEASIVKTRAGSVLSRNFILKTDHYPSGRALDLEINVHGAPNFRAPHPVSLTSLAATYSPNPSGATSPTIPGTPAAVPASPLTSLNVFGCAQPRTQGLRAILSVLNCRPGFGEQGHVVWFCTREEPIVYISGRPFVLRDVSEPRKTLALSDRTENLEGIETRLKQDILAEASKFGGLVLTHNEIATDSSAQESDTGLGAILPTWTAVDASNVKTSRELWESMKLNGWNVDYYRVPISPDRPIEDNYLDAYLRIIKSTIPSKTSLVFSCGMGAVRTTFAMVTALVVRKKKQELLTNGTGSGTPTVGPTRSETPTDPRIMQTLEYANAQQDLSRSLLRLTWILQQSLQTKNSQAAIELLLTSPTLLDNLRKAYLGNYSVILSLLGCLDHGLDAKKLVDRLIDSCDHVRNLREDILIYRLKYSLTTTETDEDQREEYLDKASKALEKYFFMIAFASYVDTQAEDNFKKSFSDWLQARTEIWNQITFLRKSRGSRLNVFAPVNDLSALSKTGNAARSSVHIAGKQNDVAIAGGQILGDEWSDHVLKNRSGIILRESTLLKSDQWFRESHQVEQGVRGAINWRNIPGTNIYALGQPTISAINEVVERVKVAHPSAERIVWITLREEPLVYVNGAPYCLRRERFSLRNMKDYGGISASRLEVLEERLKDDVIAELNAFGGRLLLHTETPDGSVIPVWEEVRSEDVAVLKDVMAISQTAVDGVELHHSRIPITAERPPDPTDLNDLIDVVVRNASPDTPIVVNCQLGRGRSTLTSIILILIQQWLETSRGVRMPSTPQMKSRSMSMASISSFGGRMEDSLPELPAKRHSYQVINNLLRVIRKGPVVKNTVDEAIDQCSAVYNLRDSIEDSRSRAEEATDPQQKRIYAAKGLQNLRRYFNLIIFQAYLQSTEPDTMRSFETFEQFVQNRPVIKTFEKELQAEGLHALKPLERADQSDSVAHPDEVKHVVINRSGSILSASTILKSDFFSNLQKMSLPERIDGAPNFRRVPLILRFASRDASSPADIDNPAEVDSAKMVCGSGMPTVQGLRRALARIDAGPDGTNTVFWTSLREEPVIYIAGRPHVLRLVDRPLENVEATGITTAVVETMEASLKKDVLRELRAGEGRLLLHDEVEERPGQFEIIPLWENIDEADIMTPRDVFELMKLEGFKINYGRVAVTDEQAPLPDALWQLFTRIRTGLASAGDFVFNCQMGRGRTTTGMITACLIATTLQWDGDESEIAEEEERAFDTIDGPSEEDAYLRGEFKTILQLVGVLSHGKVAKRLTDQAVDAMQDVQNLRKTIYDYKLKCEACEKGSSKQQKLMSIAVNYLYRYGTMIVFASYLIEAKVLNNQEITFPEWLREHREITKLLGRRSLD
ncbi:hypothetical protein FIBSPDRAFT_1042612 [Athelia psychrophila]|uniref:Paladin n=1 Tax=Athelia psychrophila TaxID=1759441 RepID=A0A166M8U6_9AGAM|nr:hypothetical protein FIBSPDRAFT_1042612 [Fibularhizoctonia sp. CBS 109695]